MNFSALHEKLNQYINKGRLKSPWVVHYDCGSCNGCDIEVLACLTPVFDVERFGIVNIGDPKHADVLLVTGTVNQRNKDVLKNLYDQMPEPKAVIAIGACATTAGIPGMEFHQARPFPMPCVQAATIQIVFVFSSTRIDGSPTPFCA